jgi:selenocysteine lyase/cysteine desulfurase
VDEKLCVLGQRNDPSTAALPGILGFHQTIGKKNIENRVRQLCSYLKEQIQTNLPQAEFITPLSPELSGGVVILSIPGKQPRELFQQMYEAHGIACAPTGGIRLSPHIYNTLQDMDKIVEGLVSVSA